MPTLEWIGKKAVVNHHKEVPFHLLKCDPKLSVGDPGSGNLLVQGDNLVALKALLPYYAGKVKCIYIDPPYNTGNENWVYNDNVNSPEMREWLGKVVGGESEDLSRHDKWLCMMYPRLYLLRLLLREDGAIFINIDDNEIAGLRLLMSEIFGANNFIACFVWQKRKSPDNDETFATSVHDYILSYSKNRKQCTFNRLPRTEEADARYLNPDNDPRGLWTSSDLTRREYREHDYYEITLPSGRKVTPAKGRSWSIPPESYDALLKDNRLWFGAKGDSMPRRKRFLSEVSEGIVPTTWLSSELFSDNQASKRELRLIFPNVDDLFQTPKPIKLLKRIIQLATQKDSIVFDSFSGTGTLGHAVLELNKEDGGKRKFVLIEMDNKVCEQITSKRLSKAIVGYKKSEKNEVEGLGSGFRFALLGNPFFDEAGNIRGEVKFGELAAHVYFCETGEPIPKQATSKTPLLGVHNGTAVYLLYNGVLADKSPQGGNALTRTVLAALPPYNGARIIYGTSCRIGKERLKRENIIFKQIPYELKVD